ncbi:helix-turn-helix domain-containing protein [Streptomyces sp. NPDC059787]|uniref:helix-turn-helix domain-containing protein n=1 Tax=Streptomyces sp. NPDC059787 TaxID=3346947 RepID=UPI003664186C
MSAQDDVAEFAALLRELKERTDRSYGSLARRLNMNTSTLHRYCAGDAVPVDFAPVERFAALCGASRAERLDLHHRWLRAVETRRRPRGPDGPAAPGTPPATDPVPGSAPDPDTVDRSGPGAGGSGYAGGPVVGSDVVSGPSAGEARGRRPWYRRRKRVAVALAAACALLATVGSLSALPDDRQTSGSGSGPVDAPPVTSAASGSAEAPRGRTSSPSPSPSGSATVKSGPSSPKARREPGAPSAPAESDAPVGAPPLTWSADSHVWAYGCGHDYVVAEPPERVPPPPAPQDAGTWAAAQSAVHGGETLVELSVQGTSGTAVVLTALRVRVAGRSGPAPGNAYAMDQGCGGALTPRSFDVDLDKDRPIARAVAGNDAGTPIPAVRMPYRVSATDPEVLRVTARTADCDCRWYLELDWSSQGRTGTVRVDDHGRPFRTSGVGGLPHYEYDTSARGWKPRIR